MRILQPKSDTAHIIDPSEIYRPESKYNDKNSSMRQKTDNKEFRNYDENLQTETVKRTYKMMHEQQTVKFVQKQHEKWLKFDHAEMTMMEAIMLLDNLVDESDPDTDLPNSVHAFQTAERIRAKYPEKDWWHLTGLIHDVGKVMALWGEPQWCVVGDTFPVGCAFQKCCVFHEFFKGNPDLNHEIYSKENGIYEAHCGLKNVSMSWGHDEYLYQMLKFNNSTIPEEALYQIRFHSFFPLHSSEGYLNLCDKKDLEMLPKLKEFSSFDLYSKAESIPDIQNLMGYYQGLIDKYIPGVLKW